MNEVKSMPTAKKEAKEISQEKVETNWRAEMGLEDDPRIGSTIYIQINDLYPDPENANKKMNYNKWLSLFPAAINELNGEKLAKDLGFDNDEQGNNLRRLIYLGTKNPSELTQLENEKIQKLIVDNQWESINDIYESYITQRAQYLKKRAGIMI